MILWRALPFDPTARRDARGGALWFPRALQGTGRHDNRERYGCLYVAVDAVAPIAELLAPFRGTGDLADDMLLRGGRRVALAALRLDDEARLIDLDDAAVLLDAGLRPSQVATHARAVTQALALRLYDEQPQAAGLRWCSTLEALWINVTLFDRAARRLGVEAVEPLHVGDQRVREAAAFLGLGGPTRIRVALPRSIRGSSLP